MDLASINWQAVGVISGIIMVPTGALVTFVLKRIEAGRQETTKLIASSVKVATEALVYRLNVVDQHLDKQDALTESLSTRTARLEGWLAGKEGRSFSDMES